MSVKGRMNSKELWVDRFNAMDRSGKGTLSLELMRDLTFVVGLPVHDEEEWNWLVSQVGPGECVGLEDCMRLLDKIASKAYRKHRLKEYITFLLGGDQEVESRLSLEKLRCITSLTEEELGRLELIMKGRTSSSSTIEEFFNMIVN